MIRGVIKVVDNLDTVDTSKSDPSLPPAGGGSCCGGAVPPSGNSSSSSQAPSIYGSDLSKVPTETIIKTAIIAGKNQSVEIKGVGYEFKPLIVVVAKNLSTKLTFDLTSFDNPDGKFELVNAENGDAFKSFDGKKAVVDLNITFDKVGGYGIVKDSTVIGIVEVVDDIKTADLEKIRQRYIQ